MVSVLRTLQAEWNSMVPAAMERAIPRVRRLNAPLETIQYRQRKVEWLRAQLLSTSAFETLTFGVEIECMHDSRQVIADAITAAGVPCVAELYNHTTRTTWKVVTDGSLNRQTGIEVVSPPLRGEDGLRQLRLVCKVLTEKGCKVSKKCGFHVHVGAQAQGIEFFRRLAKLYSSAQSAINRFLAPSRSNNGYCHPLRIDHVRLAAASNINELVSAVGQVPGPGSVRSDRRYRVLNFMSYWQHGTVEFRQHQGTVEARKAENWVRLCLRMCLMAQREEKTATSVPELMEAVEATQAEREYFLSREDHFQNGTRRRAA